MNGHQPRQASPFLLAARGDGRFLVVGGSSGEIRVIDPHPGDFLPLMGGHLATIPRNGALWIGDMGWKTIWPHGL